MFLIFKIKAQRSNFLLISTLRWRLVTLCVLVRGGLDKGWNFYKTWFRLIKTQFLPNMNRNNILHVNMDTCGKLADARNIIWDLQEPRGCFRFLSDNKQKVLQGHIKSSVGFKQCCPQAYLLMGPCLMEKMQNMRLMLQQERISRSSVFFVLVKELQRAYSNICSESFELVKQIHLHSFELSQCLQTSQQTLPNHHAVARQRRQSRFQWEERHGRLLGETALMEARQKETSIKVWWHTSERFVISPSHLGYQWGIRRLHRWVGDLTFCRGGKIRFQFQSHTAELQTVDDWMAKQEEL